MIQLGKCRILVEMKKNTHRDLFCAYVHAQPGLQLDLVMIFIHHNLFEPALHQGFIKLRQFGQCRLVNS